MSSIKPIQVIKSNEYSAFTEFLSNNGSKDLSNSIDFWCCTPKYFFTPNFVKNLRNKEGLADPYHREYIYKKKKYAIDIQPALIKSNNNGKYLAFFPGSTEELIEDVLIKILSDQNNGVHNSHTKETWVYFSLQRVKRELKNIGKERNFGQIKHALKVMSLSVITIYEGDTELWTGTLLQDLTTVNRQEYLDGSKRFHFARLPLPITNAIDRVDYRQFNFKTLMKLESQLARFLFKRLVTCYKQASLFDEYSLLYSSVKRDSGLLEQATERDNRKKLFFALTELERLNVILPVEYKNVMAGLKIIDVKYSMTASNAFTGEQKAANKRTKDCLKSSDYNSQ